MDLCDEILERIALPPGFLSNQRAMPTVTTIPIANCHNYDLKSCANNNQMLLYDEYPAKMRSSFAAIIRLGVCETIQEECQTPTRFSLKK